MPITKLDWKFSEEMQSVVEVHTSALDVAIAWIADNLSPSDVFDKEALAEWATENGFVKE